MKKRNKNKKQKGISVDSNNITINSHISYLDLFKRRSGGSVNIKGIGFQLIYSCHLVLSKLKGDERIQFEGLEDIDYFCRIDNGEYIQLKSSQNSINAGIFWEMNVLQNFIEVYKINPNSSFKVVHNSSFSKGNLQEIASKNFAISTIAFWKDKFIKHNIDITNINIESFLRSIIFEKVNEDTLKQECLKNLIERFHLNAGTEIQYFNALFNSVFQWSKNRSIISFNEIEHLILAVKESFSKYPSNPAIQNNWITPVLFEPTTSITTVDYFDGKAAKPIHIANDLPVRRPYWENEIEDSINNFDVTLIKASSGQGKSTLAWLVSKSLSLKGYAIFQLNYCSEWNAVAHLADFVEARVRIGQIPLIVIDGLNQVIVEWGTFVEKVKGLPVKFLITSREEDWHRYGYDLSKLMLKPIEIKLSMQEAQDIYVQLKLKNKLHVGITKWQPAWEKVEKKGLLIEYVYLLTQGEMIKDRLQDQIKKLNHDRSSVAKIEILRLISLADVMNIKLQTSKITNHICSIIQLETDRNEIYKQLEKEYYIKFDRVYIEGLHPIRSQHLVEILHEYTPLSDSIVALLDIVDEEYIYDFFRTIPFLITNDQKNIIFQKISSHLSGKKFSEIVYAIDGLMQAEAMKYWNSNRSIFDDISNKAGLEIFVYDTLPYTKLNTIENIKSSTSEIIESFEYLFNKLKELNPFSTKDSDVVLFINNLERELKKRTDVISFEGLGFLAKWFNRLDLNFPQIAQINEQLLLSYLRDKDLDECIGLFNYYNITNPQKYNEFINNNKDEIIGWIKRKTNTLTIEDNGSSINMYYLLDNSDSNKANEFSVHRINTIFEFFPDSNFYCTKAIILPFPNEELYKVVVQNSLKEMPKKNIFSLFEVHINQIWVNAILDNYRTSSIFEWQKQYMEIRTQGVEFAKSSVRLFEIHINKNNSRLETTISELVKLSEILLKSLKDIKKYPSYNNRYYEKGQYEKEQGKMDSWCTSLSNFINQMGRLISPQHTNDRNLAIINLRDIVFKLSEMQSAFASVTQKTFEYFQINDLFDNEKTWYERLYKTILFYLHHIKNPDEGKIIVVKNVIDEWFENDKRQKLEDFHNIIVEFEAQSSFHFFLPDIITQEGNLKYGVIGVEGIDLTDPQLDDLWQISLGLINLDSIDVDFFTFVFVFHNEAYGAFRVGKNYFQKIRKVLETGETEDSEFGNPIPVNIDEDLITPLKGIKLKKINVNPANDSFIKIMFTLWKLTESRNRLNMSIEAEANWLDELENSYTAEILKYLPEMQTNVNKEDYNYFRDLIDNFISKRVSLSINEIVDFLNKRVEELNSNLLDR